MTRYFELMPVLEYLLKTNRDHLTVRQLAILIACKTENQTVRGLAIALNLNKPAITRAANKLVDIGYMKRTIDPKDKRSVFLSLTVRGKQFANLFY